MGLEFVYLAVILGRPTLGVRCHHRELSPAAGLWRAWRVLACNLLAAFRAQATKADCSAASSASCAPIRIERKIRNPAVVAICDSARRESSGNQDHPVSCRREDDRGRSLKHSVAGGPFCNHNVAGSQPFGSFFAYRLPPSVHAWDNNCTERIVLDGKAGKSKSRETGPC